MYNRIKTIILDFDGTIFRVFANYDLHAKSVELSKLLKKYKLPFAEENDVFDAYSIVFDMVADVNLRNKILFEVDNIIKYAEIEALNSGIPIEGFLDFLEMAYNKEKTIAIASNNSIECIQKFLSDNDIAFPIPIIGRNCQRPDLMKPNIYMLDKLCRNLNFDKLDAIFVGDNFRDYECAKAFGCEFIGLASTNKKRERLEKQTKDLIIVNNFYELSNLLLN